MLRTIELQVDNREHKVIEELNILHVPHTVATLDVGDYAYIERGSETNKLVILERKTYADLAASVKDSRYKEQKTRMASAGALKLGYILEGSSRTAVGIPSTTIDSILLGLCIRDGYALIHSISVQNTANILYKLLNKLAEYLETKSVLHRVREHQDAIIGIHSIKRNNMTPAVCYLSQLAQIPGVSAVIARTIADTYPNMYKLLAALTNCGISAIQDLKLAGNGRRIGDVLSNRIVTYLAVDKDKTDDAIAHRPVKITVKVRTIISACDKTEQVR